MLRISFVVLDQRSESALDELRANGRPEARNSTLYWHVPSSLGCFASSLKVSFCLYNYATVTVWAFSNSG